MTTYHHNISGELTQELVAVGEDSRISSLSLTNIHASTTCTVDLYLEKKLTGKFYIMKSVKLPVGVTLIKGISFDNSAGGFGLFIKLTKGASETPTVDVILT